MNITVHQRPGVYSSYDASSVVSGNGGGSVVGVVAVNTQATAGQVQTVASYEKAVSLFGSEGMAELIRLALKNGASAVAAVAVADRTGYEAAFETLGAVENVAVVICDSTEAGVHEKLRASVIAASESRRERIAVVSGGENESVDGLIARAGGLNHERMVLVAPGGVELAAAVAGAIAGQSDPAIPLGGAELYGLRGLSAQYTDGELDVLILGGVTPVERVGGMLGVVRGVTTRTQPDATWRDLTTIRIVDDVIPTLRNALRAKFKRAKNTQRGRGAIRAQVVLELEEKVSREIITGYEDVAVTQDSNDPTRCLVEFSFTVAHGLNQIWLSAHIAV